MKFISGSPIEKGCHMVDHKPPIKTIMMKIVNFLHAKPWIPGGEKSIFTVVIH